MRIYVKTAATNKKDTTDGYGSAKNNIEKSLTKLGHVVPEEERDLDIKLNFTRPQFYDPSKAKYNIGYTPWESITIPKNWSTDIKKCDELWTTSDFCANLFEDAGYKVSNIFEHGIEKIWTPKKREFDGVIKFLHIGLPEGRKGGVEVLGAFIDIFGGNPKYSLTLKAYDGISFDMNRIPNNVKIISKTVSKEDLVKIHHDHDVMIYPSYGEGFGLIPLQALATGMPVISTSEWASYRKYIGPLSLKSSPAPTRWEEKHPGMMLQPSISQMGHLMTEVAYNFEQYSDYYFNQAGQIIQDYDWDKLTKNAFSRLAM